jgi:hypothetical protein
MEELFADDDARAKSEKPRSRSHKKNEIPPTVLYPTRPTRGRSRQPAAPSPEVPPTVLYPQNPRAKSKSKARQPAAPSPEVPPTVLYPQNPRAKSKSKARSTSTASVATVAYSPQPKAKARSRSRSTSTSILLPLAHDGPDIPEDSGPVGGPQGGPFLDEKPPPKKAAKKKSKRDNDPTEGDVMKKVEEYAKQTPGQRAVSADKPDPKPKRIRRVAVGKGSAKPRRNGGLETIMEYNDVGDDPYVMRQKVR